MIEETDTLKGLKNDKAIFLDNEQTNGHYNHSKFESISSIDNCWKMDNMIISNSRCIPKTTESIMNKQTGNIFIRKNVRSFTFGHWLDKWTLWLLQLKIYTKNNWQESWINRPTIFLSWKDLETRYSYLWIMNREIVIRLIKSSSKLIKKVIYIETQNILIS